MTLQILSLQTVMISLAVFCVLSNRDAEGFLGAFFCLLLGFCL